MVDIRYIFSWYVACICTCTMYNIFVRISIKVYVVHVRTLIDQLGLCSLSLSSVFLTSTCVITYICDLEVLYKAIVIR